MVYNLLLYCYKPSFMNEESQALAAEFYTGRIPEGEISSTNRKSPYYSKDYAMALKPEIDAMLKDAIHNRKFFCSDFGDIKVISLYLRLNQSMNYLIDHLDDKYHSYKQLKGKTVWRKEITNSKDQDGVTICWRRHTEGTGTGTGNRSIGKKISQRPMVSRLVEHTEVPAIEPIQVKETIISQAEWRKALQDFLDDEHLEVFEINKDLLLDSSDIEWIKSLVGVLSGALTILKLDMYNIKIFKGPLPEGVE